MIGNTKVKEFHSEFRLLEVSRHEELTDKMTLHFFELKKLPNNTAIVSPEFKELERLRSMTRHNETSALRFEREQATAEER